MAKRQPKLAPVIKLTSNDIDMNQTFGEFLNLEFDGKNFKFRDLDTKAPKERVIKTKKKQDQTELF